MMFCFWLHHTRDNMGLLITDFIRNVDCNMGTDRFYVGVPDSKLKPLCNYLYAKYGVNSDRHIIAANEGNALAIAAGHYMTTGSIPVVYMQNSGLGNIVNPYESLMRIYGIPCILIIGWRGEPGIHDEPQHQYQGQDTLNQLDLLDIQYMVLDESTDIVDLEIAFSNITKQLEAGKSFAFVVRKGGLLNEQTVRFKNSYTMKREEIIEYLVRYAGDSPIISTTGKTSRELFEIREKLQQGHEYDFLTVGSMGHSSSIALGVAKARPTQLVWCIDGDGAAIMHLGAMAVIGANKPANLIHIVMDNESHESVGGLPTASATVDFEAIAKACGYECVYHVSSFQDLDMVLSEVKTNKKLTFIVIDTAIGSRADLGRPTTSPKENLDVFMTFLSQKG